jgi:hypothetical protein
MEYKVATFFNQDSWSKNGANWLRQAKSQSLEGFVVGIGLGDGAKAKIAELGFEHIDSDPKGPRSDLFKAFVPKLNKGEKCLWMRPETRPTARLKSSDDVVCGISDISLHDLVKPVLNLYDRVAIMESIKDRMVKKYDGCLSASFILGSREFWVGFLGCQLYLCSKSYLDDRSTFEDLVLNFFLAFENSFSVEVKPYPET